MRFHAEYIEGGSTNRLIAFGSSTAKTKHWGKTRLCWSHPAPRNEGPNSFLMCKSTGFQHQKRHSLAGRIHIFLETPIPWSCPVSPKDVLIKAAPYHRHPHGTLPQDGRQVIPVQCSVSWAKGSSRLGAVLYFSSQLPLSLPRAATARDNPHPRNKKNKPFLLPISYC